MSELASSVIQVSEKAKRTTNPIRKIVDNLKRDPNHPLKLIDLALGDPTIHGPHLQCPQVLQKAVVDLLMSNTANGYQPSFGCPIARDAVAKYSSCPGSEVCADDVIIGSAASGALELAITVLVNEGDNILVPRPGFPLYQVITESLGGTVKHYSLKAELGWECDLEEMESLIDSNTKAILINNPSNPCGSSFSEEHLRNIVAIADRHRLPIIADEIYGSLVFDGHFTPIQTVRGNVPVLSVSGIAKAFVVPGWRCGWIVIHDHVGRFSEVRPALRRLTQLILGCASIIQLALPKILTPVPGSADEQSLNEFHTYYSNKLKANAEICRHMSHACVHFDVIVPKGAMYAMVEIKHETMKEGSFVDDADFCKLLLEEENLSVLPGQCFGMRNFFRLVTCPPADVLEEAFQRIRRFCERRAKN